MDELELVQEAVSNWESLDDVDGVEVTLLQDDSLGDTYISRILLRGRTSPVYLELRVFNGEPAGLLEEGVPASWRPPGHWAEAV